MKPGVAMKRTLIAVATLATLVGTPALAADMALKAAPPAAPAAYSWTGWYAGLNAGGDWGTSDPSTTTVQAGWFAGCPQCVADVAAVGNQRFHTQGFTGGGQLGYNWQINSIVTGLEADFEDFRSRGSNSVSIFTPTCPCTQTVNSSMTTDWLFTLRPRVGVAANNWLFYGTGGLAVSELKGAWSYTDNFSVPNATESGASTQTKAGWVAGGGVEAALPGNWVVGAEYLYVKFNNISTTSTNLVTAAGPLPTTVFTHSEDLAANIVRVRLSKKF
jgi:outer membrane immunogenic protein